MSKNLRLKIMLNDGPLNKNRFFAIFICKVIGALILFVIICYAQQSGTSVLLPESAATTVSICTGKKEICKGWKPTKEDIQGLEANLSQISHLKSNWRDANIHIDYPKRYFWQYLSVTITGENLIYVNAFCVSCCSRWGNLLLAGAVQPKNQNIFALNDQWPRLKAVI